MSVKSLMTAAAEAMLRGDADAVEKANAALAELRSEQAGNNAQPKATPLQRFKPENDKGR